MTDNQSNKSVIRGQTPDVCPHCGNKLSPWEKVILSVDRLLTCKKCWYRIILDVSKEDEDKNDITEEK